MWDGNIQTQIKMSTRPCGAINSTTISLTLESSQQNKASTRISTIALILGLTFSHSIRDATICQTSAKLTYFRTISTELRFYRVWESMQSTLRNIVEQFWRRLRPKTSSFCQISGYKRTEGNWKEAILASIQSKEASRKWTPFCSEMQSFSRGIYYYSSRSVKVTNS